MQRIPECSDTGHVVDGEEEIDGAYAIKATLALAALGSVSLELKYHYKEQHESQSRQSVCVGRSLWIP